MSKSTLCSRLLLVCLFSAGAVWGQADRKPNILLVLVDDLGWPDVSAHGSADVVTPHIDSIGMHGARFTAGYVTAPQCSPARAGLLTGCYQSRFGHDNNSYLHACFASPRTTIADRLKSAGYDTAAFGKWHLGEFAHEHPMAHGFDEFWGFLHGGRAYLGTRWQDVDNPLVRGHEEVPSAGFLTDSITTEAIDFMVRKQSEPWFAYLAYNAPHSPLQMPPAYTDRVSHIEDESRARFVAMMMNLDDNIGRIIDTLQETGQWEDTLIVFLSDNGGQPHANASINLPFRGKKGDVYEGGVRIPFMVQWPREIPAGQVVDYPVFSLDVLPTALAAARSKPADDITGAGVNLLPALTQRLTLSPRPMYWRWSGQTAVRLGDWKWVQYPNQSAELYRLDLDPYETTDLTGTHPAKAREMAAMFAAWDAENPPLNEAHQDRRERPTPPTK